MIHIAMNSIRATPPPTDTAIIFSVVQTNGGEERGRKREDRGRKRERGKEEGRERKNSSACA